jgi:hypothetical protein
MRIPIDILNQKLKDLGLITETGEPISFAKFKKLADIHQYGSGQRRLFIIFVRNSKENMFAFYPPTTNRPEMLKICYEYLLDTIQTEMKQEFLDGNVQWGNCGIPLAYGDVRAMIPF